MSGHAIFKRGEEKGMPSDMSTERSKPPLLGARIARTLGGTAVGALLGAGYGALVMGSHFATTGRWDQAPTFAVTMAFVGSALGLLAGLVLALTSRDK
jgi:hypothetical protein